MPPWEKYKQTTEGKPWEKYTSQPAQQATSIQSSQPRKDVFDVLLAGGVTPREMSSAGHWVLGGLQQTAKDVLTPFAHFGNQFLLNLPRALAHREGMAYPEAESGVGTVLSKAGGVYGAVKNPLLRAFGGPAAYTQAPLMSKVGQSALLGGAYTPTEDVVGLGQRTMQAGGAAILGGVGAVGGKAFSGAKQLKLESKELKDISNQLKIIQQKYGVEKLLPKELPRVVGEKIKTTKEIISKSNKVFDQKIIQAAEGKSVELQTKLGPFFKQNSQVYGERLDDISNELIKKGTPVQRGQVNEILKNVISEVEESGLTGGRPAEEIRALMNKYKIIPEKNTYADDIINLREWVDDLKRVKGVLSTKVKSGYGYTPEDISAATLMREWGNFAEQYIPNLKSLNSEYRPVVKAMQLAGRIFKPYGTEMETGRGTRFLISLAKEKILDDQSKILRLIEEGGGFAKGIGKVTLPIRELGKRKLQSQEIFNTTIKDLEQQGINIKNLLARQDAIKESQGIVRGILKKIFWGAVVGAPIYGATRKLSGGRY